MYYLRLAVLWILGLLPVSVVLAQVPVVTLSEAFDEPQDGWDKLLQLRNGNTVYLHFSKRAGLRSTVYNLQRKQVATDSIVTAIWNPADLESTEIDGIYEIGGQPVIFLQQIIRDIPVLIRLVLDSQTGRLLREDKLGELPSIQHRSVVVQDNLATHDCFVEKDARSDYYAVAFFSGAEIQRNDSIRDRIQVLHFSPEHKLVNKGRYYLADTSYSYFSYVHMSVQDHEKVYITTVGFNDKKKTGVPASKVLFSMLSPDSASFTHRGLDYTAGYSGVSGYMQAVPMKSEVRLLLFAPSEKTDGNNGIMMNTLMTSSGKLRKHHPLYFPELSKNVQWNLKYKDDYKGAPQRLLLNVDGSCTLLLETLTRFKQGNTQINKYHTNMGDIGIALLDTAGREDMTMAVSKLQSITGVCEAFSLHRRAKSEWAFRNKIAALNTNTYLSYDYVATPDANFVLFNDYLQYLDGGGQEKTRKPLKYAADANFVCYRFYGGKMERLFIFGQPEVKKGFYCMMGAAAYDESTRVYATIMLSRTEKEKVARIAWIKF
ncbi:hypothetical protein ECE50_006840 [Chitinophaga sp. Mgbs1]|uniref:Uncharacterized protein n=1 Tax=Chitinophaga solisilvae TaxID=1233460 RepID=A0A433WD53_9BACT|nr:hypothetical protein [Chitinophaga solisilvae]